MAAPDEDAIDEILYLARANEASELASFLAELSTQSKRSSAELVTAAVDSFTKNSALHYAVANGHIGMRPCIGLRSMQLTQIADIIKLLFSFGSEKPAKELINAINDAGNTPLHWAALNGHLECVKLLIQAGADVTIINRAGHDAVFEAEINDKKEVVDWLLGAVEELENGIAQNGEGSQDADESMDDGDKGDQEQGSANMEDVRKRMEDMKTGDGASKNG